MYLLRLLGGISVEDSSGAVPRNLAQQRPLAVLALLASARAKGCSRDKLIAYLWPEIERARARHRLTDALHQLRKSLGDDAVLASGDILRLNSEVVGSDVGAFLDAIDQNAPESAVQHYDGPFLDGFYVNDAAEFERWVEAERQRLGDLYAKAMESLGEQADAASDYSAAAEWWKRAVAHDPYNSRLAIRLMESLAAAGDRGNALKFAEEHERRLREELDMVPDSSVLALVERLRRESGPIDPKVSVGTSDADGTLEVIAEPSAEKDTSREQLPEARPLSLAKALLLLRGPALVTFATLIIVAGLIWYMGWSKSTRPGADRMSVAVLPFVNLGGDPAREYFSDGITDEIITRLSKVADLKVISRTSVMQYKDTDKNLRQIGEELGVATVVEGQVLQIGDRVRINAQLINARTDTHLWADQYERQVTDIFEIQSDISKQIVAALQATLTPVARERIERRPTDNLEAYDLYLLGRHRFVRRGAENLRDAIRYFEAAIDRDSSFALAWAGLADAWSVLPWYEPVPSRVAYAWGREAAQRALRLDEDLAEAHAALGGVAIYYEWEWNLAEAHLLRAVELDPNYAQAHHWLGLAHLYLGRRDQGIQSVRTAISLNPLGTNFPGTLAYMLYDAGRVEEALAIWTRAEKFDPPIPSDHLYMSLAHVQQGLTEEGFRLIRRWGEVVGYPQPKRLPLVLRAFEATELTEEALAVLEDVRRSTGLRAGFLALLYLNLDAPDEALRIVQEGIDERHFVVPWLGKSPFTRAKVLENPEIVATLQEAGIRFH